MFWPAFPCLKPLISLGSGKQALFATWGRSLLSSRPTEVAFCWREAEAASSGGDSCLSRRGPCNHTHHVLPSSKASPPASILRQVTRTVKIDLF